MMIQPLFLVSMIAAPALALEELTDDTFVDFISQPGTFCVMFYSPSCGACQEALPVFKKVAKQLSSEEVRIGQIDVSEHSASGDRYDVWNYPTIVIDGKKFPFQQVYGGGNTNAKGLATWIRTFGSPSYTPPISNLWILNDKGFWRCIHYKACVVQFTDSRCIQCNARRNQIHEAANNIDTQSYEAGVRIAQIDLYKYPQIGAKYGVELRGFVVHKVFSYGRMFNYYATDDWSGMVEYAVSRLQPALQEVKSMEQLMNDFYHNEKSTAIALMLPESPDSPRVLKEFAAWVESTRDICKHFVVTDKKLLKEYMDVTAPKIVIKHYFEALTTLDPPYVEIPVPESADEEWFGKQFKENEFSLVNHIDGWRRIKQVDHLKHYVGVYVDAPHWGFNEIKTLKEQIGELASRFKGQGIHFFIGDITEVSVHFEEVDTINAPVKYHFMIRDNQDRKYTPDLQTLEKVAASGTPYNDFVASYIEQYLQGNIDPKIKSDPDPGDHTGIIDVMGLSIDRVFSKTKKDIMLLMTSSNQCRSCSRFEDVLLEFGGQYENPDTLTVGMINAETNELPRKLVMKASPPNIVLLPGNREGLYDNVNYFFDEITVDNLKKFVVEKGTHKLTDRSEGTEREQEKEEQELEGTGDTVVDMPSKIEL